MKINELFRSVDFRVKSLLIEKLIEVLLGGVLPSKEMYEKLFEKDFTSEFFRLTYLEIIDVE